MTTRGGGAIWRGAANALGAAGSAAVWSVFAWAPATDDASSGEAGNKFKKSGAIEQGIKSTEMHPINRGRVCVRVR